MMAWHDAKQNSLSQRTAFWEPKCWKGSRPQGKQQKHMMHFLQPKATLRSDKTQMLYNCGRVKDPARYLCIYFTQIRFYILYISHRFFHLTHTPHAKSIYDPIPSASARSTATKVLSPHSAAHLFGPRRQLGSSRRPQRPHAAREFREGLRGQQWDEAGGDQRDLARERCFSFFNHGRPWWLVINN